MNGKGGWVANILAFCGVYNTLEKRIDGLKLSAAELRGMHSLFQFKSR